MVKYVKANSDNYLDKYWNDDYEIASMVYPIFEKDDLRNYNKETISRIISTIRRVVGISNKDMSIYNAIIAEDDEHNVADTLADWIKDTYSKEESKSSENIDVNYVSELYRLMYGTESPMW